MTHEEFNNLYDSGKITLKIYTWKDANSDDNKCVEAFEYNGKFYLRIHTEHYYHLYRRAYGGHNYRMCNDSHFIKEFTDRNYANNYFKKICDNWTRVK